MLTVAQPIAPDFEQFARYARQAFEQKRFTNGGPLVGLLELRLRELIAARNLILVSNGTAAIELALRALKVRGEIITTPFTFCATSHAITWTGGTPVFVDVVDDDLTIDPKQIEAAVTPRTEAIVAVHVFGRACDVEAIDSIAKKHGLAVVYDGAHAFNVSRNGVPIGRFGDATTYSFHATKLFHTGEGGAIEAADAELAERLRTLRNFGIESEDCITSCGTNAKMPELSAALGLAALDGLTDARRVRSELRGFYDDALKNVAGISVHDSRGYQPSDLYYVIRVDIGRDSSRRDKLYAYLKSHGILARRYFYPLTSEAPFYASCARLEATPVAFRASRTVLALPFHSGVSQRDRMQVAELITAFANGSQ
jgi:dTDP-4-amino-4,6-dideoxygalactose transaminase